MSSPRGEPHTWSDAELIGAVLDGRAEAYQPLVERYQQRIFAYLYRLLLRDQETARDLTQAVFLKAYQNLRDVDRARPLQPWLYRIAHNEAANLLRTRARHPEASLEPEDWARVGDPTGVTPESHLAERQEQDALHRALGGLRPQLRSALVLHYFEDRSYQEIAEILQVPLGTVGTLIHRGRKALRAVLAPEEADVQPI
ncbi:MAG TPA: RNA polymerase sigma factor [bacterium]|nr:RNA polymerase sigma factor [bacterium]